MKSSPTLRENDRLYCLLSWCNIFIGFAHEGIEYENYFVHFRLLTPLMVTGTHLTPLSERNSGPTSERMIFEVL